MEKLLYQKIHHIISLIPSGKVATFGQIAEIVGGCTARMVGYAASAVPQDSDIPWQRVINYQGGVSQRSIGSGKLLQQKLLEAEGIEFNQYDRINLEQQLIGEVQYGSNILEFFQLFDQLLPICFLPHQLSP